MNEPEEAALSMAVRHVMEGEERVGRQEILLEALVRDRHERTVAEARRVLETLQHALQLARDHMELERERSEQSLQEQLAQLEALASRADPLAQRRLRYTIQLGRTASDSVLRTDHALAQARRHREEEKPEHRRAAPVIKSHILRNYMLK